MKLSKISLLMAAIFAQPLVAEPKNLTGKVLDEQDNPVVDAEVHIRRLNKTVTTDAQGLFRFEQLEEGRYVIDVEAGSKGHINQSINHNGEQKMLRVGDDNTEIIVVTGNPLEHSSLEMTSPAVIISGDNLIKNRGANIGETLAEIPGVNLSSFGSGAGRPVIRGQQGNRVTVLSNNSSTQDASNASPDHWIAAEPLLAERVEILKGPATLLYGGGAVGGAINVVDKKIPTRVPNADTGGIEGGFELRLGDSPTGERAAVGGLTAGKDEWAFRFEAFDAETDSIEIPDFAESEALRLAEEAEGEAEHSEEAEGILDNSDTDTHGGSVGFSYITDAGYWGIAFSQYDRNYGLPGHAEHHEEHEEDEDEEEHGEEAIRLDLRQKRIDLKGQWNDPFEHFQSLKMNYAYTDYEHREIEGDEIGTTFTNDADELRLELVHKAWAGWQGAFGLQYNNSDFAALGDEAFIPATETNKWGLFWLEEVDVGDWHTELGIRWDRQEIDAGIFGNKDDNAYSFAAGTLWHINEHWSLPINFARAQRLPSVEELYSNAGNDEDSYVAHLATLTVDVGDDELDKETANNWDIGLRFHTEEIHASLAVFHNRVDDFIYQQLVEEDHSADPDHEHELPILQFSQKDAVFEGVELEVDWVFADDGKSLWKAGVFGDYTHAEFDDGNYIPRQPAKRFGASLGYQLGDFSADLKAIDAAKQDKVSDGEFATDGYTLVNLNLGYNLYFEQSEMLLFLRGQNLLDEEIRDHASYLKDRAPRAGRSLLAGMRITF
ncbi:TonB-dependent receptor [Kangiella sp. TOML190]|uniref:TonB-dependent receptor n=1 Tax=Kangiella sp. TOML190 TaxID=2931351 RepID=UPI0020405D14|nr:TonB-dependent receptor [Kangiella sp. TOML190]